MSTLFCWFFFVFLSKTTKTTLFIEIFQKFIYSLPCFGTCVEYLFASRNLQPKLGKVGPSVGVVNLGDDAYDLAVCHGGDIWRKEAVWLSCRDQKSAYVCFVGIKRKCSAKLSVFGIFAGGVYES